MLSLEIRVKGQIDKSWSGDMGGLAITYTDSETLLSGTVPDQAALYGILSRIADLGLDLISVVQMTAKGMKDDGGEGMRT
jgi:hypothetical protein